MQSALLLSELCWGTMFYFPFLELVETKLRSYEICNGIVCNTGVILIVCFPGLHIWLCQLDLGYIRKL